MGFERSHNASASLTLVFTSWIFIRINVRTTCNHFPLLFGKSQKKKKKRIESRIRTKAFWFLVQKLYSIKRCFCEAEFGKELNDLKIPYVQTNNINFERCKESQGISYNRNSLILSEFIRLDKKLGLLHNSPVLIKDFLALLGLLNYCYQWNFVLHRIHSE